MRTCTRCGKELPLSEFHQSVKRGKPYTYPHCKPCHRAYVKAHYDANKQAYVDKAAKRNNRIIKEHRVQLVVYFAEHPCIDCGATDVRVLTFDHRDPKNKSYNIADMIRRAMSWESIQLEIAKCDVRCYNCHACRTCEQFGWWSGLLVSPL